MTEVDRMPPSRRVGVERLTDVSHVIHIREAAERGDPLYPTQAERRVMGMGLPSWQRDFVWSQAQCKRFIESIWSGINIGGWMFNVVGTSANHPLDGLIIDGQQRLTALERYLTDEFPMTAADGTKLYWSELNTREQRRFGHAHFPYIELNVEDEDELKRLYDLHNFGGTPHRPEDRAARA